VIRLLRMSLLARWALTFRTLLPERSMPRTGCSGRGRRRSMALSLNGCRDRVWSPLRSRRVDESSNGKTVWLGSHRFSFCPQNLNATTVFMGTDCTFSLSEGSHPAPPPFHLQSRVTEGDECCTPTLSICTFVSRSSRSVGLPSQSERLRPP
jgi:hypothetical protein